MNACAHWIQSVEWLAFVHALSLSLSHSHATINRPIHRSIASANVRLSCNQDTFTSPAWPEWMNDRFDFLFVRSMYFGCDKRIILVHSMAFLLVSGSASLNVFENNIQNFGNFENLHKSQGIQSNFETVSVEIPTFFVKNIKKKIIFFWNYRTNSRSPRWLRRVYCFHRCLCFCRFLLLLLFFSNLKRKNHWHSHLVQFWYHLRSHNV